MKKPDNDLYFSNYINSHDHALKHTEVHDADRNAVSPQKGMDTLCNWSKELKEAGRCQHFIGNGASMAFANHMALDWTKNGGVTSNCYASASLLTAVVNDMGVEHTFSAVVDWYAQSGDMLATISTSGNSPNILKAIESARRKSMKVVTFSGLRPDNSSRKLGDLNFYIPAKTYGIVECAHQVLLHLWLDQFMKVYEWDRDGYQNMRSSEFQL